MSDPCNSFSELAERDLLEQAVRHGRARGLLSAEENETLMRQFALEGINGRA